MNAEPEITAERARGAYLRDSGLGLRDSPRFRPMSSGAGASHASHTPHHAPRPFLPAGAPARRPADAVYTRPHRSVASTRISRAWREAGA